MMTWIALVLLTLVRTSHSWLDLSMSSYGLCLYGNTVECCWGWKPAERGRCQPHCQQGCKHGECVAPDRCKCHPGYAGKACNHDLNECGMKPRPCKHRCMNTPGSYKCYCQDGYTAQPDGSCRNARTCFHANCQYGCEVVKGAVRCTCPSPGLRLGPDRRTCVDINECVSGGGVCPHRRKCVNTFGSFVCKCHHGFRLTYINGRYKCIDKDTRPFCSLNPSSPKCHCRDGSCSAPPRVTVEPQTPRVEQTTWETADTATPRGSISAAATTAAPQTSQATTMTPVPASAVTVAAEATTVPAAVSSTTRTAAVMTTTYATPTTPAPPPTTPAAPPTTPAPLPTTPAPPPTTPAPPPTTPAAPPTTPAPLPTTPAPPPTTPAAPPTTPAPLPTTPAPPPTTPAAPPTAPAPPPTTPAPPPTTPAPPPSTPATTQTIATTSPSPTTIPSPTTVPPFTEKTTTTTITTTLVSSSLPAATTANHHLNKEVTHRQRGDVHIPRRPSHNHVWDFDVELGETADEAADDPGGAVLQCSFDRGLCDWMSDGGGDVRWEIGLGPAGGRYLSVAVLEAGQRSIRGARLSVPVGPPLNNDDLCFSFSHCLTGHRPGTLQLFVHRRGRGSRNSHALWSRTRGNGWRRTRLTLTAHSADGVLLKADRRAGQHGLVAIDDVMLKPGPCL